MNKFEIDSDCADRLIREQRSVWALLDKNCQALERVETRIVFVEEFPLHYSLIRNEYVRQRQLLTGNLFKTGNVFFVKKTDRRSKSGLLLPGSMSCLPIRILFSLNI